MFSNVLIVVIFFLVAMAALAGVAIGLLIGLALGGKQQEHPVAPATRAPTAPSATRSAPESLPYAPPYAPQAGAPAPRDNVAAGQTGPHDRVGVAGGRATTSWSVALAFGFIIGCCACTLLMAVAVTLGA